MRYNNIKQLIFNNKYYTFTNIKYNINDDELIIYENNLLKDLFDSKSIVKNPMENYNTYDTFYKEKKINKSSIHSLDVNKLQPDVHTILIQQ